MPFSKFPRNLENKIFADEVFGINKDWQVAMTRTTGYLFRMM